MAPLTILHVEDDPDDAFFFSRAIKIVKPECQLHLEINGVRAIEYLREAALASHSSSHPIPNVMILDLKLPGLSGFDVLSWTRDQSAYKALPIFVLSGSSLPEDQTRASELGASEFIVKDSDYGKIAGQVIQFMSKNGLPAPRSQ
jgi:two-component system response regulator